MRSESPPETRHTFTPFGISNSLSAVHSMISNVSISAGNLSVFSFVHPEIENSLAEFGISRTSIFLLLENIHRPTLSVEGRLTFVKALQPPNDRVISSIPSPKLTLSSFLQSQKAFCITLTLPAISTLFRFLHLSKMLPPV